MKATKETRGNGTRAAAGRTRRAPRVSVVHRTAPPVEANPPSPLNPLSHAVIEQPPAPPLRDASDDELVAMIVRGEVDAGLAGLHARYARRLTAFVRGMVGDVHLAADITQEVFAKLLTKASTYRPGTQFRAWLLQVTRNHALTVLRALRHRPRALSGLEGIEPDEVLAELQDPHEDHVREEQELMEALRGAVDRLPESYRVAFNLCVRDGASYADAAKSLGIPTGTVGIRIMRARQRLFAALCKHFGRIRRPPACCQDLARNAS
jgi:RNA polymerase sigma-70 factor (ECF subfamily)